MSKNLFEVNGITYTDNIPNGMCIGITKEQFAEYEQLKQKNKQLKSILTEIENMCKEEYYERNTIDIDNIVLSSHLDVRIYLKIKELKEEYK